MHLCTQFCADTPHFSTVTLSLCASLFTISAFTFVFGLFLGVLLTKCFTKLRARNKPAVTQHAQVPLYEEVPTQTAAGHVPFNNCKVKDNVAYGPIKDT